MPFKIPQSDKKFKQDNSSDRKGNIHQTKNISFDEKGYLKLSDKTRTFATSATLTDLCATSWPYISGFVKDASGTNIGVLGTKNIYWSDYNTPLNFVKDTDSGFPTLETGGRNAGIEFSSDIYIVNNSTVFKKAGSTWSTASTTNAESICLFENLNQLAVGNENEVELYNTSDVLQNTLSLPPDYVVTKMAWNRNKLAIATINTENNRALLFIWDGLGSDAESGTPIPKGLAIYSVAAYKDGWAVITSAGELLYFNGGFQVLDRLPIYYTKYDFDATTSSTPISCNVFPNAMITDGEYIYIGLSNLLAQSGNSNTPRRLQDFPGGIWCYDPEVGLHHRYSIDTSLTLTTSAIATTSVDTSTDIITVAGVTVQETGTPVFYYNGVSNGAETSSATPLKHGEKYYTIYQSDTTLKLAETYADAIANTAINLTGTGNNAQFLEFVKLDMFSDDACTIGALMLLDHDFQNEEAPSRFGRLLIGGSARQDDGTEIAILASVVTDQENRGYFITPRLESDNIEDTWQKLYIKHEPLINAEDKIVVKYRTSKTTLFDYETYNIANVSTTVWVDSNTYTTTVDLSDIVVGNEVSIYRAKGCGVTAHITAISENAGTYTVTIDEDVPDVTAGDILNVYYNNWIKLEEFTSSSPTNSAGFAEITVGDTSKWIQFKVELRGSDVTIEELQVSNQANKYTSVYNQ